MTEQKQIKKPVTICINPPPRDRACECCGKTDMKPFGGAGDPLVGDFKGALLLKTFREFMGWINASWECRNCIILNDVEFDKKQLEVHKQND